MKYGIIYKFYINNLVVTNIIERLGDNKELVSILANFKPSISCDISTVTKAGTNLQKTIIYWSWESKNRDLALRRLQEIL